MQIDMHVGTCVELATRLKLSMSTVNTIVKNCEEIERNYVQCGPFSKQWKSLKHLPLEELESALAAWFKQACESIASIDGTYLKEKALHIATHLEIANFSACIGWIGRFKRRHSTAYRNLSGESRSVDS
jgi:hypothetical protein